jgi:tetratricopeptide (TPR) repeat protein
MYRTAEGEPIEGHIFLSHAGTDTVAAAEFAEILRRNGVNIWLDRDELQPGELWMLALEDAIQTARGMIVYVGGSGVQKWVDREFRLGLVRNVEDPVGFRLIPVLGVGAESRDLPPLLQQHQCIDLRDSGRAPAEIRRLLETLLRTPSERPIRADYWAAHTPFHSLEVFPTEDSWLFFGRDVEIDELLTRLARSPVLAILGNSGSGKSSLLRAGLVPALQCGRLHVNGCGVESCRIAVFRPGGKPFDEIAETVPLQLVPELSLIEAQAIVKSWRNDLPKGVSALRDAIVSLVSAQPQGGRVLLIADQFEEIFTLTGDTELRRSYIEMLFATARIESSVPVHLVISMRADFFPRCIDYPELGRAFENNLFTLALMSPAQMRDNIEKRLALANAKAEPGLIDSLLNDAGTEPGNLALLEHALSELWYQQGVVGRTLTVAAYTQIGRLRGALAQHADRVYRELEEHERDLTRRIFLELVQLGEGAPDTRRRVHKQALLTMGQPQQVEALLARLASSRLISTGVEGRLDSFVEVSHEALIRNWPALVDWISRDRAFHSWLRQLQPNLVAWRAAPHDAGRLLAGYPLATAEDWLARRSSDLAPDERTYIEASIACREAAKRKTRRIKRFISAGAVTAGFLIGIAWFIAAERSKEAGNNYLTSVRVAIATVKVVNEALLPNGLEVPKSVLAKRFLDAPFKSFSDLHATYEVPEAALSRLELFESLWNNYYVLADLSSAAGAANSELKLAREWQNREPSRPAWLYYMVRGHENLGDLLRDTDVGSGEFQFKAALRLAAELPALGQHAEAASQAEVPWQNELAHAHERFGDILRDEYKFSQALAEFTTARDLMYGSVRGAQRNLAIIHGKIGDMWLYQGRVDEAEKEFRTDFEMSERLSTSSPTAWDLKRGVAVADERLGFLRRTQGRFQEAFKEYEDELEKIKDLLIRDNVNFQWRRDQALAHEGLGDVFRDQKQWASAIDEYRLYLKTMQDILAQYPNSGWRRRDVAIGHQRIGNAQLHLGRLHEARSEFEECRSTSVGASRAFDPRNPEPRYNVSDACQSREVRY